MEKLPAMEEISEKLACFNYQEYLQNEKKIVSIWKKNGFH